MQSAADLAALSGATAMSDSSRDWHNEACYVANQNRFANNCDGVAVNGYTVTPTLTSFGAGGSNNAVQVIISKSQPRLLSAIWQRNNVALSATSIATYVPSSNAGVDDCVLVLNGGVLSTSGNGRLNMPGCGVAVNGTISIQSSGGGGNDFTVSAVSITNGTQNVGGQHANVLLNSQTPINSLTPPDPYVTRTIPSPGTCVAWTGTPVANTTYCSHAFTTSVTFTQPGYYIFSGGSTCSLSGMGSYNLCISGNGTTVTATSGVTIIAGSAGIGFKGNGVSANLVAPTSPSGTVAGLAIVSNGPIDIKDSALTVTGAIYAPTQTITFENGNSSLTSPAGACTQVIAHNVTFLGTTAFNISCQNAGNEGGNAIGKHSVSIVQ
jgi:hypothetical protein